MSVPVSILAGPTPTTVADNAPNPIASKIYALSGVYDGTTSSWQRARQGNAQGSSLADVTDRTSRLLGHVTVDNFPANQDVTVSNFPATQPVSGTVAVSNFPAGFATDIIDNAARLLGHVTVDNFPSSVTVSNFPATQPVSLAATITADTSDRAARLLGHVTVDNFPATQPVSIAGTVAADTSDRAGRLLGHVTVDTLPAIPAGANAIGSVSVSNFPPSQPVSSAAFPGSIGDGVGLSAAGWPTASYIFNGTNWERMRSISPVIGQAATTGVLATASVLWDQNSNVYRAPWNAGADSATSNNIPAVGPLAYTGSLWERLRTVGGATNTTGVGVLATGILGFDGTNYQRPGVLAVSGDAGQNPLITAGNRKEDTFSTSANGALAAMDCSNYRWVSVQVNSVGTGGTITWQGSNDNVNWQNIFLRQNNTTSMQGVFGTFFTNATTAVSLWEGPMPWRYFRLNVTGLSAGTASGVIERFSIAPSPQEVVVAGITQSVASGTADAIGGTQATYTWSQNAVFNGTNWDRLRSASSAANTTGTGLQGAGLLAFDGTNWQPMGGLVGDTGQNSQLVAGNRKEVSFTTTTVQAVASTDVSNYRWVSVHITSQGTSSSVVFQVSNDNVNWVSTSLVAPPSTATAALSSTTSTGVYHGPVPARYFRLNVTGISAGTTAGVIEFFSVPAAMQSLGMALGYLTPAGDASATRNTDTAISVFNGTNWDRVRSGPAGANNNGIGSLSVVPMAFDSTNSVYRVFSTSATDALTATNTASVGLYAYNGASMDRIRTAAIGDGIGTITGILGQIGYVYNGASWDRLRAASGDALAATGVQALGNMVFNGTNWDRARSAVGAAAGTLAVSPQSSTSGGATPYKLISAATTNATAVKGSAGNVYAITAISTSASVRFLKLYDKATAPTVGTDVPVQTLPIPASTTGAGLTLALPVGMAFANGIAFAITGAVGDADATAIAANEVVVNLAYK